ncbi:hypothetical protein CQ064_08380 [Bacillus sp. MYb78]|nr:hypothetical protein bthur0002_57950 [Bacillus thuringiensis Bt407]PQZ77859.1 hypothetical protein CQ064_08380 [Bacillus sp. MYb78]
MLPMNKSKKVEEQDKEFIRKLADLHNLVTIGEIEDSEFDAYVMENKEHFSHPICLAIIMERIKISTTYFDGHYKLCEIAYGYIREYSEWVYSKLPITTTIKLAVFEETFEKYKLSSNE